MTKTDLSSSSKQHVHTRVPLRKPLRCGFTILLCSCLFFGATHCRAQETQDAAEAARQERARKEQPKQQKHVYTEDDLGRAKILTPEDEARFAAQRQQQSSPAEEQTQAPLDASVDIPQLPLGDIARRYRNAKLAMHAPAPFHLPFDEPTFAAPIISVAKLAPPLPSFSPAHPNLAPTRPKVIVAPAIPSPAPLHRVDPFARRATPAAPSITRIAAAPHAAQPSVSRPAPVPAVPQPNLPAEIAAPKLGSPKFAPVPAVPVAHTPVSRLAPAPAVRQPSLATKIDVPKFESRNFTPLAEQPNPAPVVALPAVEPRPSMSLEMVRPSAVANTSSSPLHTVVVQPGDSLWRLAQQNLGRGSRWQELLTANPGIADPTRLAAGTEIVVPAKITGLKSDLRVAVQPGDTLTKIAQATYGRAAAWHCVAQANPEIADPNRIYEGQQLLLPFNCKQ
ncbi:MAG TPA: LysM peptidoglycan-binding domain-containing protein [Candidatus Acidoferrum sp.]